ncbi:fumarylacetoacetate hydrolase [Venturia nashicola]|uniref:Fumarylacetoacetate hydrolase n=1 Tax=Venturia nashicola TaxID=86259 RepID=A0A4Z1PUP7_9PEZI|nr:fumarylacetoacetate hydrolase [Venturia nashicola]TLD38652.1 fumarylacetoacetate hydrolase [Venturia nashicola]
MVESGKPLLQLPAYEHPPAYSRAPSLLAQSFCFSQIQPHASQGFLPGGYVSVNPAPEYTAFDETLGSFELRLPLIHVRNNHGETRPRYQLSQELTKSGKPWRLKIRRVLPTESRHLSSPPNASSSKARIVEYDDDTTLYLVEDHGALNKFKSRSVEIRGRRAKTLPGIIKVQSGGRFTGSCDFLHMTKSLAKNSLKQETEERIQKYGYHANDDWEKKKLFSTTSRLGRESKLGWKDGTGKIVATERGDVFEVMSGVDQKTKDALVTCFVAQRWASGKLRWNEATTMSCEAPELIRAVTRRN